MNTLDHCGTYAGEYRISRGRFGVGWVLKLGPGWHIVHRADLLQELADWLRDRGVDIATVTVVAQWPWRSLAEHLADANPKPSVVPEHGPDFSEQFAAIKATGCFRCDGTREICNICGESARACQCPEEEQSFFECPDCK